MTPLEIGTRRPQTLGPDRPALVVAEIGQNHNGRRELAEQLIDAAAWAGADAVKVVKRDLRSDLSREARDRAYDGEHSYGSTYGKHRSVLELSAADHAALRQRAAEHGLLFFATACDLASVELMAGLDVDAFKVASRDLDNAPLVESVAQQNKPVLLSTGMSGWDTIDRAAGLLNQYTLRYVLMQCTSLYPTPTDQVHLASIRTLAHRYGRLVGYSDHTQGILVAPVAVALGAVVVEKHLTMNRRFKGTDHAVSVEPEELRQLIENIRQVERARGCPDKPVAPGVGEVRAKLGRSLVTRYPLCEGTTLTESMLTLKSPGDGVPWDQRWQVLGRRLRRNLSADVKLSLGDID